MVITELRFALQLVLLISLNFK